jgi:hypothetical protein
VVTVFLNRIGNLGLLLIAGALLLGGLAGAAVVHYYDRLSVEPAAAQQHNENDGQTQVDQNNQRASHKGSHRQHQQL